MPLRQVLYPTDPDEDEGDEEEEEEEGEEEEYEDEEDEEEDEEYVPPSPPRIRQRTRGRRGRNIVFEEEVEAPARGNRVELVEIDGEVDEEERGNRRREVGEASSSSSSLKIVGSQVSQSTGRGGGGGPKENEMEGACCPICMETWSSEGSHHISCLPCGHVYGFSCIDRWIRQKGPYARGCPQCSKKCMPKNIIKLYLSRILVADGELQKKNQALQTENEFLKMMILSLQEKAYQGKEENMPERQVNGLGNVSSGEVHTASESVSWMRDSQRQRPGPTMGSNFGRHGFRCCNFKLEDELVVDGARIFDIDASSQTMLVARRLPAMAGDHVLTKISLVYPYDSENIQLPPTTKAIKDIHFSPSSRGLALFASLGKKLSTLSMESNNIVLSYDLPFPAWSCSWDLNSPFHLYAGLQNGTLLVFDMRHTTMPLESMNGLSCNPLHTVHSLVDNPPTSGVRTVLSASSIGPCVWSPGERPFLVPDMENQGVCISLACCPSNDDIVASFRPKVETCSNVASSQSMLLSPSLPSRGVQINDVPNSQSMSLSPSGPGRVLGSHVLIKRVGASHYQNLGTTSANVNNSRMTKSAIVNIDGCRTLFAYGDELTNGLNLYELPSLRVFQRLKPHEHPILDVKFAPSLGRGILGCTSEDRLQIFSARIS